MKIGLLLVYVIIVFAFLSCQKNFDKYIVYRLELVETNEKETWCDNHSGIGIESCIFLLEGKPYRKILHTTVNEIGELDSVYWYGNPMGAYKMEITEYLDTFLKIDKQDSSCLSTKIKLDFTQNLIVDGCDTLQIDTNAINSESAYIILKKNKRTFIYGLEDKL